ncbi:UvrD-helicase domain-containing protein [Draconibacterium orientale]|uniref:UvrD-helicase domain-containing protein n=1 Tax=Draconibacterium orientale TaxID=1168034 RepID=UPI002A0A6D25|nr:UvrD-helicase domain-containing protein [Draconibacterium orientale]
MSIEEFISKEKSLLIAPAGFGKTHSLAECLERTSENEKQLILTHTHAGIASIKEKIRKLNIPSSKYQLETITGFAQKYTLSFYCNDDIPKQEDANDYYPFVVEKATELFKIETIQKTLQYSYQGLFVDEYQDCTDIQHQMITELSSIIPTHILGDPLQGIFDFNGDLVDFDNDLKEFEKVQPLTTPWRWNNANENQLGEELKDIRDRLEKDKTIKLEEYNKIESVICNENDWFKPGTQYRNKLSNLLNEESLLIIHPITSSLAPRLKIVQSFNNRLSLLESIDEKDSYSISQNIDDWGKEIDILLVKDLSYVLFNKSGLDVWFNEKGFKRKTEIASRKLIEELQVLLDGIQPQNKYSKLSIIIKKIMQLPGVKCYRKDMVFSLGKALDIAETENISVHEAMVRHKNIIRRVGRKIIGKCIGTTLLTKGLEFDTVAILNAHKIENKKHFYVATTRACKRLVIFSNTDELTFN